MRRFLCPWKRLDFTRCFALCLCQRILPFVYLNLELQLCVGTHTRARWMFPFHCGKIVKCFNLISMQKFKHWLFVLFSFCSFINFPLEATETRRIFRNFEFIFCRQRKTFVRFQFLFGSHIFFCFSCFRCVCRPKKVWKINRKLHFHFLTHFPDASEWLSWARVSVAKIG